MDDDGTLVVTVQHSRRQRRAALLALILLVVALGGTTVALTVATASDRAALHHSEVAVEKAGRALAQARAASRNAVQAIQLSQAIAAQRHAACVVDNKRHDNTLRSFNLVYARAERQRLPAAQRRQLKASRASTILLLNALAPRRVCR